MSSNVIDLKDVHDISKDRAADFLKNRLIKLFYDESSCKFITSKRFEEINNFVEEFIPVVLCIIHDISSEENFDISCLNFMEDNSYGEHSFVIFINNKVLKIGFNSPESVDIPLIPYINSPIIRVDYANTFSDNGSPGVNLFKTPDKEYFPLYIEVYDKCKRFVDAIDGNVVNKYSKEFWEIYELYRGIRDLQLVFTDSQIGNIGVLLHDNDSAQWNVKTDKMQLPTVLDKYHNYRQLGFSGIRRIDIYGNVVPELKCGDLTVLDVDCIDDVNDLPSDFRNWAFFESDCRVCSEGSEYDGYFEEGEYYNDSLGYHMEICYREEVLEREKKVLFLLLNMLMGNLFILQLVKQLMLMLILRSILIVILIRKLDKFYIW